MRGRTGASPRRSEAGGGSKDGRGRLLEPRASGPEGQCPYGGVCHLIETWLNFSRLRPSHIHSILVTSGTVTPSVNKEKWHGKYQSAVKKNILRRRLVELTCAERGTGVRFHSGGERIIELVVEYALLKCFLMLSCNHIESSLHFPRMTLNPL